MLLIALSKLNVSLNPVPGRFQLTTNVSLHSYFSLVYSRIVYSFNNRYGLMADENVAIVCVCARARVCVCVCMCYQYIHFLSRHCTENTHRDLLFTHSVDWTFCCFDICYVCLFGQWSIIKTNVNIIISLV